MVYPTLNYHRGLWSRRLLLYSFTDNVFSLNPMPLLLRNQRGPFDFLRYQGLFS